MKVFFQAHKKLHIWLLTDGALLALFWLARGNRGWMNALADHVTTPLQRRIGAVCYRAPFSVAEALCVLLVLLAAGYLVWSAVAVARAKERKGQRAYGAVLGAACAGLTVYAATCLLWGVNYYIDGFQDRSGIYAQPVAPEDLQAVTEYFANRLAETADNVERDEDGLFAVSREEILAGSVHAYDILEEQFPFLAFDDLGVKPISFSRAMSALDFTGVYCPFTGEANVNVDSPACLLPSTAAHEMAHQRGIASEQECNFLAVLASTTCGSDTYAYAGWLMGYIHLGNALYRADQDAWRRVRDALPETVMADLRSNNAYWAQFQDHPAQQVSNKVYDGFLKGYGQELGIQTYGTVVDLLVVYYRDLAGKSDIS